MMNGELNKFNNIQFLNNALKDHMHGGLRLDQLKVGHLKVGMNKNLKTGLKCVLFQCQKFLPD